MSEPKDNLYDISDAIALSRLLTGEKAVARKPSVPPDDGSYIRFSAGTGVAPAPYAARIPVPSSSPAAKIKPEVERAPLPKEPFLSWEEALTWCIEYTKARCGFIADSQGFVMITDGKNVPEDAFEGVGANIGSVFIDIDRLDLESAAVRTAEITYEQQALLVARVFDSTGEYCIIGLISYDPAHPWPKQPVYDQIMKSMTHLTL